MEQRRLRLGDILDDYCPRERRVTNHVIVAMVEDDVKQTRCSTCDADHEYKQARVPSTRRKKDVGVLAADAAAEALLAKRADVVEALEVTEIVEVFDDPPSVDVTIETTTIETSTEVVPLEDERVEEREDDGPVHRRLIRATLPRPEGQAPERKETEFTVRQQQGQGGRGREVDGNRPGQNRHRQPHRPGGGRPGETRFGSSPGNSHRGGGGRPGGGGGRPQQGQPGGNPQGGQRNAGPGGGEGRFRRRRGR
jgi:hypothetical protein